MNHSSISINKVIFIQNYLSSGSLYVQSLLDNHPDVLSMPGLQALFLMRYLHHKGQDYFDQDPILMAVDLVRNLPEIFDVQASDEWGLGRLGENNDQTAYIDKAQFMTRFCCFVSNHKRNFLNIIMSFMASYNTAIGIKIKNEMILCLPLHSTPELLNNFIYVKNVFILHVVRDPITLYSSIIRHITRDDINRGYSGIIPIGPRAINQLLFNKTWNYGGPCYGDRVIHPSYRSVTAAVRLEDIKADPESVMRRVAAWIGAPYDPVMTRSTFLGLAWGNRTGSPLALPTGATLEKQRRDSLSPATIAALASVTHNRRKRWGYAQGRGDFPWGLLRLLAPLSFEATTPAPLGRSVVWLGKLSPTWRDKLAVACMQETIRRRQPLMGSLAADDPNLPLVADAFQQSLDGVAAHYGPPQWWERALLRIGVAIIDLSLYLQMRRLLLLAYFGVDQPAEEDIPPLL